MPNIVYNITANSAQGKQALKDFNAEQKKVAAGADQTQGSFVKSRNAAQEFSAKLKAIKFPQELLTQFNRLQASIHANGDAIKKFGDQMHTAGGKIRSLGAELAIVSLAVGAIGGGSVKSAATFETQMTKIRTLVLGVDADTVQLGEDIKALAVATGIGPAELADAMFVVQSAGARGSQALDILTRSAKASALGLGETNIIARAVTGSVQAFSAQGLTAAEAVDTLVATVREGNLETSELAGSLGRVGAIASQAGLSFQDVGGFIATFTRAGVGAEEAVTSLRGVVAGLLKPASQSKEAFAAFGTTASEVREKIGEKGLAATMVDLISATGGNEEAMAQLIPNIRALAGVLSTAGAQGENFIQIEENIKNATGILNEGFAELQKDTTQQFKLIVAELQVMAMEFGSEFLPIIKENVIPAFKSFVGLLGDLTKAFGEAPPWVQKLTFAVGALLVAAAPVAILLGTLISALGTITAAFGAAAAGSGIFAVALTAVSAAALPVAAVIGTALAGVALGRLIMNFKISGRSIDDWILKWRGFADVQKSTKQLTDATEKLAKILKDEYNIVIDQGRLSVDDWNQAVTDAYRAARNQKEEVEKAEKALGEFNKEINNNTDTTKEATKEVEYWEKVIASAEKQFTSLGGKVSEYTHELEDYNATVRESSGEVIPDLNDAIGRSITAFDKWQMEMAKAKAEADKLSSGVSVLSLVTIPELTSKIPDIPEAFKNSLSDAKTETKSFADDFKNQVSTVVTNFAQAVGDMVWEWEGFGNALKDIGKKFISAVISLFVEQLFTPLLQGFSSLFSGKGFSLGGSGFSGIGSLIAGLFKPASTGVSEAGVLTGSAGAGGLLSGVNAWGLGIAGAILSGMMMLNAMPLQPGGTMPAGAFYPTTLEGTDFTIDPALSGLSGANLSSIVSNVIGKTVSGWDLEGMGISPEDIGLLGFDSWAEYYQSLIEVTEATEEVAETIGRQAIAIDDATGKTRELADTTKAYSDVVKYTAKTFEDLNISTRSMFELAKTTGIVSTQLKNLLGSAGLWSDTLAANALTAKNMSEASTQFASLATGLGELLPSLDLGISDFLTSGVMSDALRQYIQDLGGDVGLFEAYAGLFAQLGEGQNIADLIADSADAQQIVADAMAEAAGLSITAEEKMRDAVDAFDAAVNNFADALYYFERYSSTGDTSIRPSGSTPSASDFVSRTDLHKPADNETAGTSNRTNFALNVQIDSPVTVSTNGSTPREDADVIAAKVNEAMKFNNKGLADNIANYTSRILKSRGDI